jgi:uncharacterized protein (DUF849 family)
MKTPAILLLLSTFIALPLHAQAVKLADLPAQEQALYNQALDKARQTDAYKQANKTVNTTKAEVISKADPSLKPLADKMIAAGGPWGVNVSELTPQEKTKWETALQNANQDPAMTEAFKNYDKVRNDLMIKSDPNVKPILEKMFPYDFAQ